MGPLEQDSLNLRQTTAFHPCAEPRCNGRGSHLSCSASAESYSSKSTRYRPTSLWSSPVPLATIQRYTMPRLSLLVQHRMETFVYQCFTLVYQCFTLVYQPFTLPCNYPASYVFFSRDASQGRERSAVSSSFCLNCSCIFNLH